MAFPVNWTQFSFWCVKQYTPLGHWDDCSIFVFVLKKKYKNDLFNYKKFIHVPEIKSGPGVKCLGWGFGK